MGMASFIRCWQPHGAHRAAIPAAMMFTRDIRQGNLSALRMTVKLFVTILFSAALLPHCLQCHRPPVQFIQQSNRRILMMLVRQEIVIVVEQTRGVLYRH